MYLWSSFKISTFYTNSASYVTYPNYQLIYNVFFFNHLNFCLVTFDVFLLCMCLILLNVFVFLVVTGHPVEIRRNNRYH